MIKFFRKNHKWLGIGLMLFIVLFALSGIVLNHRRLFSPVDVTRSILPKEYRYKNWNNAAIKGAVKLNDDTTLLYGNIGIWLSDSLFSKFTGFNTGFPKGIDNRKISKVFKHPEGGLFAGTLFGLYRYNVANSRWEKIKLSVHGQRITDIIEKDSALLVMPRSCLLKTIDYKKFSIQKIPAPEDYDNKTSLFKTLWLIHSGEILGLAGKLIVDLSGLIFIFLSITGLVYFINRYRIKGQKRKNKNREYIKKSSRWNLLWHNKIGWASLLLLATITLTGIFLRPPLLTAIARTKIKKIPYTKLDSPNPWYDKLRAIRYDAKNRLFIISTADGMYYADEELVRPLRCIVPQPPVSAMGINVFEKMTSGAWLVGSFSGLFEWYPATGAIYNRITGKPCRPKKQEPPVGDHLISGYILNDKGTEVYLDYNRGAIIPNNAGTFAQMPEKLAGMPISLWNLALEIHTARIYKFMFGNFYILIRYKLMSKN